MPRKDGTGPMDQGSMSGRGLGVCTGVNSGGHRIGSSRGIGRRSELGFGAVNGCRRGFGYGLTKESIGWNDKKILEQEKALLEKRLDLLNKQLENRV